MSNQWPVARKPPTGERTFDDETTKPASSNPKPPARPPNDRLQECCYCRSLNKPLSVYTSHSSRDSSGKVICEEYRKSKCGKCGATGDWAHPDGLCQSNPNALQYASEKLHFFFLQRRNPNGPPPFRPVTQTFYQNNNRQRYNQQY